MGIRMGVLHMVTPIAGEQRFDGLPPLRYESILGWIVERITEPLLDIRCEHIAAVRIPLNRSGHRLDWRNNVFVA
jgi:hypothetical protein